MVSEPQISQDAIRARYAAAAARIETGEGVLLPCPPDSADDAVVPEKTAGLFGGGLYDAAGLTEVSSATLASSLGCGVPTAVADLQPGETVLDLGSGAGADVLISARRVGPTGQAIGLDMTPEMLSLARRNAAEAGVHNVRFLEGFLEDIPLPNDSVDVVVSNCALNLSIDKPRAFAEAARVLRPGGRLAVSDVLADPGTAPSMQASIGEGTGCVAGVLTEAELAGILAGVGLTSIEVRPTHRVHDHAYAAIIRARRPE